MNLVAEQSSFEDFGLSVNIQKAIKKAGFTAPSEIQKKAIPYILSGADVIGQAKTGTGKTAAFTLPSLDLLEGCEGISMLVVTPTRELARQVCEEINFFGKYANMEAVALYGGQPISIQKKKLQKKPQIIVGTPGRLLDLLKSKKIPHFHPSIVVLDEADEMLDMGFLEDIEQIFSFLPEKRQTLFFSATMPPAICKLANKILHHPVTVNTIGKQLSHQDIQELYYLTNESQRETALIRYLDAYAPQKSIVFCRTKKDVDELSTSLKSAGYRVKSLHGDIEQRKRTAALDAFRDGICKILVATDVACRGINVLDVSHVFNYQFPFSKESYTHRIGRTGRAGRKGTAVSLLSPKEYQKLTRLLSFQKKQLEVSKLPSRSDVEDIKLQEFVASIKNHPTHDKSRKILEKLQQEMSHEDISINLLSMLVKDFDVRGPEDLNASQAAPRRHSNNKRKRDWNNNKRYHPHHSRNKKKSFSRARS